MKQVNDRRQFSNALGLLTVSSTNILVMFAQEITHRNNDITVSLKSMLLRKRKKRKTKPQQINHHHIDSFTIS